MLRTSKLQVILKYEKLMAVRKHWLIASHIDVLTFSLLFFLDTRASLAHASSCVLSQLWKLDLSLKYSAKSLSKNLQNIKLYNR